MHEKDMEGLARALFKTALEAGEAIMRFYGPSMEVREKKDASPVTDADHAAEEIILKALGRIEPGTAIIAEESVAAGIIPEIGERFFLVDPLDGTKEYIARSGEFTVNIALVEGNEPSFGLIYAPALSLMFITTGLNRAVATEAAPGANFGLDDVPLTPMATRDAPASGLVAAVSRSHMNEATQTFLRDHGISKTESIGSSLKFCLIAEGRADVYPRLGPTCEWDTAAGHAILSAAGGQVLTDQGEPLTYGKTGNQYRNPGFVAWARPPA